MKLRTFFHLLFIVSLGFGAATIVHAVELESFDAEERPFFDEGRLELQKEKFLPQRKLYPVNNAKVEETQQENTNERIY
ncbi:MAG: hypothetical protein V4736_09250 [Bdellovibrionota bacterium]